jgi:hypothetical protein
MPAQLAACNIASLGVGRMAGYSVLSWASQSPLSTGGELQLESSSGCAKRTGRLDVMFQRGGIGELGLWNAILQL